MYVNFDNGGYDGSIITPSRNGIGNQTGFSNGGFNNTQQTPVGGFEGRYALEFDFSDSSLNVTGSQIDFDLILNDGSTLVHTEKVSFTVAAGGTDAVSRQADNGPVDYTVATAEMSVSNNTTTEPDYENTATTSAASLSINYNPTIREADDRHFAMAGQNALFTFNGVDIIREENEVEDLIAGIKLTLNDTTSGNITIGTSYDAEKALEDLRGFVTELSSMIQKLGELTYRGTPGGDDSGPLADDNLAKSYLRKLKSLTTEPIKGYSDDDIFLSNFGVMTERDGSLTIDETKFNQFFSANPDAFSAVMNSRATASSSLVKPSISGSFWEPGKFEFNIDADDTADIRQILPTAEASATDFNLTSDGTYLASAGNARGLAVTLLGEGEDTNIYLGKSLLDIIREFADPIISITSDVTTRINNYNDDVAEYQIDLEELNERIENSRARYTKQFSDMNSAVTGFKKTEELLTNFQEAWKASLSR